MMMKIKKFNDKDIDFESFIDIAYDLYDKYDVNISFSTADGSVKNMNIDEYKNETIYNRFLTALCSKRVYFEIIINIKENNLNTFIEIIKFIKDERISNYGWVFRNFRCSNNNGLLHKSWKWTISNEYKSPLHHIYQVRAEFEWFDESIYDKI